MASSSQLADGAHSGAGNMTTGSDAGTGPRPGVLTFLRLPQPADDPAPNEYPNADRLANVIIGTLEQSLASRERPVVDKTINDLALVMVVDPCVALNEDLRREVQDVDVDALMDFVAHWTAVALRSAAQSILPERSLTLLGRAWPSMIVTTALKNKVFGTCPSAAVPPTDLRRQSLAGLLELGREPSSPFAEGFQAFCCHMENHIAPSGMNPSGSGPLPMAPRPVSCPTAQSMSAPSVLRSDCLQEPGSHYGTSGSGAMPTSSNGRELIKQERMRTASQDADKVARSLKAFTGVADDRGFSGFWRELEAKAVRRGWTIGGPEHYYLLTNLIPETILTDIIGLRPPQFADEFPTSVAAIFQRLQLMSGGAVEIETILNEDLHRKETETLVAFIDRIDRWAKRCAVAGSPLSDASVIKAFRDGVNDPGMLEASYEYPTSWMDFRPKALVRAARVDVHARRPRGPSLTACPLLATTRGIPAQVKTPAVSVANRKTEEKSSELCRDFLHGRCSRGDKCRFAHEAGVCRIWARQGTCKYGDKCKFAHATAKPTPLPQGGKARPAATAAPLRTVDGPEDDDEGDVPVEDEQVQLLWTMGSGEKEGQERRALSKQSGPTLSLKFANGEPPLIGLLDSGAVKNYISESEAQARGWEVSPSPGRATLADGRFVSLRGTVRAAVCLGPRVHDVDFMVLPNILQCGSDPVCILGVQTMCAFGTSLQFRTHEGGRQVVVRTDPPGNTPCRPSGHSSRGMDPQTATATISEIGETLPLLFSGEEPDQVLCCVSSSVDGTECGLEGPTAAGTNRPLSAEWRSVKAAPDYEVRLRPLQAGEVRDCENQEFVAEMRWCRQGRVDHKPTFDFSVNLYRQLTPEQQHLFDEELAKFTRAGWWQEVKKEESGPEVSDRALPESIAFPVVQGPDKVRPCVDLRRGNSVLPDSSYRGRSCSVLLAQIQIALATISHRTASPLSLVTMDATAAFYKVRLSREDGCTAIVRCLGKKYRVDRMAFGIRCGPGVLEEILTALVAEVEAKVRLSFPDDPLHIWVYVDDFTLLGSRQVVEAAQKLLIERGSSWGFTFSAHKTHRVDFHPDGWVSAFKEFRHLGVTFACKCVPKRADMFELCLRCTTPSLSQELFQEGQRTTKRALFKLAGLSHDPLAIHAEQALAGDLIRRVAGKWKDLGWDEQARLTAKEADALSKAISVIRAWQREGPCEHPTAFGATELRVTTDASPYGYGYHVDVLGGKFGPVKLHRRAKFWKGPSVSWHMNRREAFCLSAAHLFVESIVMFIRPLSLRIMSDSRTALSWVQGGSRLTCRSVERVALARLCDAVCELREAWRRRYGVYSQLSHVAADENEEADALSRLGVRWRIPKEILLDGREAVVDDCECDDHGKLSDQVEGRLAIILDADAGSPPAEVSVAPGKPARRKLLQLQWQSPSARLILQCLGSNPPDEAGSALLCVHGPAPRALARELADFFVADDGVLLKRVTTARLNGIQAHRLCYFIPADTSDGKGFAEHVVSQYHDEAGCLNVRYLRWLITRTFYYPNIRRLVNDLSKSRNKCQQSFSRRYYSTTDGGRSLNEGVRSVWQTISIDLAEMGPDRYSRYHSAIFLIDHFSRYVWISPIRNSTSSAVVGALSTCFDWWGNPSLLQSDGGPAFRSAAFRKFLLERGIVQRITNPGSPFANGLVERSISALKTLCRGVANKRVWPTLLSKAFVRLNCKPLSDVGLTPHEIFFCRPRRLSVENALENDGPESSAIATLDDVANLMNVRKVMNDMVKTALHKSITDSREICGTRGRGPPAIGDEVLLFEPNSFGRGGSYGSTVYRVYGQVGRTTLQLVLAGPYQGPVNKSDILECHYFNTRPYNRPSGGHVE